MAEKIKEMERQLALTQKEKNFIENLQRQTEIKSRREREQFMEEKAEWERVSCSFVLRSSFIVAGASEATSRLQR